MPPLTLVLAVLALVIALLAYVRSGRGASPDDATREARRLVGILERELRGEVELTRRLLAEVARGVPLAPEAILDGQLWRDVDADEAARLIDLGGLTVVDVRTPAEMRAGFIPGALLIPMDELDERKHEIPREGNVLVYCAMGGRSAAACEGLSREGWSGLMNLNGGIGAWRGPVVGA